MTHQQTAMQRTAWILIGTGLLFAASALPWLHPVVHIFLQIAHWPIQTVPSELLTPVPLLIAISGGLVTGLGGMLLALGRHVAPLSPQAAATVARWAGWSWFCTDSTGSILVGAPMNVAMNAAFLLMILVASRPRAEPVLQNA